MRNFIRNQEKYSDFYIVKFSKKEASNDLLFIHGGPGSHCGVIEYLIEKENFFTKLNYNIILYDQRTCGRSKNFPEDVSHEKNISDLKEIYDSLSKKSGIAGLIGHSYGAKILYDFNLAYNLNIPSVFVATANSLMIPRLNNLMIDFLYLKKNNPQEYLKNIQEINKLDYKAIWELSENMSHLFKENKERPFAYWASLELMNLNNKITQEIALPNNENTFKKIRKQLYTNEKYFELNIEKLQSSYIWINGFHDIIMNGAENLMVKNEKLKVFYKSAHYPHIEENDLFCEVINTYFKNII